MADETEKEVVLPGDGPGAAYAPKSWIIVLMSSFTLLAFGLLIAIWWNCPDCSSVMAVAKSEAKPPEAVRPAGGAVAPMSSDATDSSSGASHTDLAESTDSPTSDSQSPPSVRPGSGTNDVRARHSPSDSPKVNGVSPSRGDPTGGTRIRLDGEGFQNGMSIKVGGISATEIALISSRVALATTPAHQPGAVDVWIKAGDTESVPRLDAFTYAECVGIQRVLLLALLAGALGGTVHSMRSIPWYVGNRSLRKSWILLYAAYPIAGASLACIFFLCLQGGIVNSDNPSSRLWIVGVSSLIGLFSREAFEKLKKIAEAIFTTARSGAEKLKTASESSTCVPVDPPSGPKAGGSQVRVLGHGLTPGTTVQFGNSAAVAAKLESSTMVSVIAPPSPQTGTVDVVITSPGGTSVKYTNGFTYL